MHTSKLIITGHIEKFLISWCLAASQKSINMNQKIFHITFKTTNRAYHIQNKIFSRSSNIHRTIQSFKRLADFLSTIESNLSKGWLIFYWSDPSFIRTTDSWDSMIVLECAFYLNNTSCWSKVSGGSSCVEYGGVDENTLFIPFFCCTLLPLSILSESLLWYWWWGPQIDGSHHL